MIDEITLTQIPMSHIDFAWRDGASALAESCEVSGGEITGDQLKLILARGERQLIQMRDGARVVGWMVVAVDQAPNMRVLFVTDLVCRNAGFQRFLPKLKQLAAAWGCSRIRCAARPAQARMHRMLCGFKPVYQILEIET